METPKPLGLSTISLLEIQPYEKYLPTAFDDSMTMLQKINKMLYNINQIGGVTNNLVKQWKEILDWIVGNGLAETVEKIIDEKIANGDFDNIFDSIIGALSDLTTTDKTTIVNAINEVNSIALKAKNDIGDISKINSPYKTDLVEVINVMLNDILINRQAPTSIGEATGYGIISGFIPRQQNVLSMALEVGDKIIDNIVHMPSGIRYVIPSATIAIDNSDSTLNRIDLVYVNQNGLIAVKKGVNAVNPVPPTYQGEEVPIAHVKVYANDTTVNNSDITDIRPIKNLNFLKTEHKENFVLAINDIVKALDDYKVQTDDLLKELSDKVYTSIGDTSQLTTVDKSNLVNAINELVLEVAKNNTNIGNLADLDTIQKDNLVVAINEVLAKTVSNDTLGDMSQLLTDNKSSLVGAINEVYTNIGDITTLTTGQDNVVKSLNWLQKNQGDLALLKTLEKGDLVLSLNEVFDTSTIAKNDSEKALKLVRDIYFNVKDYGAKGDGKTDDSDAIISAVNDAHAKGRGVVFFPTGVYLIGKTIVKKGYVSFLGANMLTTQMVWDGPDNGVMIDTSNQTLNGCYIEKLSLTRHPDKKQVNVTGVLGGSSMDMYFSSVGTFKDLQFYDLAYGIRGNAYPTGVGIFDCNFENIFCVSCTIGISPFGSGNTIVHPRFAFCGVGLSLDYLNGESMTNVQVLGGVFASNTYDLNIPNKNGCRPNSFWGTWFETSKLGIMDIPNMDTHVMTLSFNNCMMNSFGANTIGLYGAEGAITMNACTFYQNPGYNVGVTPPASRTASLRFNNCWQINADGSTEILDGEGFVNTFTKVSAEQIQSLVPNADNIILFTKEIIDDHDNYSVPNNWFFARETGYYAVTSVLTLAGTEADNHIMMYLRHNGLKEDKLDDRYMSTGTYSSIGGTTFVKMMAGDTLQIVVVPTKNVDVIVSDISTYLKAVRI